MESFNEKSTINQVAKLAGVSKTTISRYLNEKYEFMSSETRLKIEKVIEEFGYRPSNIARSLKAETSKTIGCVIADITNPISSITVMGINDICAANGYNVLFANTYDDPIVELDCIRSFLDNRVDGLIINSTGYNDEYLVELREKGLPIVMIDRWSNGGLKLDCVTTENYQSTYNCIAHLHKKGYKKVAFFNNGFKKVTNRLSRKEAYIKAMNDLYGMDGSKYIYEIEETDIRRFYNSDSVGSDKTIKSLRRFFSENPESPKAIFAVNAVTLLNTLRVMYEIGYNNFPEIGICGFNDWGWASLVGPGITTITQDAYAIGVEATQLIFNRIKEKGVNDTVLIEIPNKLVERGSTDLK